MIMNDYKTKIEKLSIILSIMEDDMGDEISLDNLRVNVVISKYKFNDDEIEKVHKMVNNWVGA